MEAPRLGWKELARMGTQGARVLIVEDEERVRSSLAKLATSFSYEVTTTASAEEADRWLETDPFDVMLLDIELPRMNGLEFLSWALDRRPEMSVIMVTGLDDVALAIECMEAGARNYLVKPISSEILRVALRDAVTLGRLLQDHNQGEA